MSADVSALADRIRRLEDRAEIAELVARYGIAVDDHDLRALVELFTADGVFNGHALGTSAGADAVAGYFEERWKQYGATFHYNHPGTLSFDGPDSATGVVPGHAEVAFQGRAVWAAFRYEDDYARVDGRWRFRSRRVRFFYVMPLDELPDKLATNERRRWPGTEPEPADLPTCEVVEARGVL